MHTDARFFEQLPIVELDAWEKDARRTRARRTSGHGPTDDRDQPDDSSVMEYSRDRRGPRWLLRQHAMWSREQAAAFLRITPNAVRLRIRRGTLLAIVFEGRTYLPVLQFDRRRRQLWRGVREFLSVAPERDGWFRFRTLVLPLRGRRETLIQSLQTDERDAARGIARTLGGTGL